MSGAFNWRGMSIKWDHGDGDDALKTAGAISVHAAVYHYWQSHCIKANNTAH